MHHYSPFEAVFIILVSLGAFSVLCLVHFSPFRPLQTNTKQHLYLLCMYNGFCMFLVRYIINFPQRMVFMFSKLTVQELLKEQKHKNTKNGIFFDFATLELQFTSKGGLI